MSHRYVPIALAALISLPAGAGLLAAAGTGSATPASSTPAAAPIPIDSLQSVDLPRFKLYGPDIASLQVSRHELDYAVNQFRRYLGESPPKLTLAVLGSMPDPSRVSAASLRDAGVDFVLTDWPARAGAPPALPELSERAARWFLAAFERANAKASPPAGKTSLVPDWYASALAGLCASPVEQGRRLQMISARLDQHIPIDRLLAMSRPAPAAAPGSKGKSSSATGSAGKSSGGLTPVTAPAIDPQFYDAEALSFARFLAMRESDRFIGFVLEPILAGEPASAGLNRAKTLFPRPDQLEAAWVAWVKGGMKNEAPQQQ